MWNCFAEWSVANANDSNRDGWCWIFACIKYARISKLILANAGIDTNISKWMKIVLFRLHLPRLWNDFCQQNQASFGPLKAKTLFKFSCWQETHLVFTLNLRLLCITITMQWGFLLWVFSQGKNLLSRSTGDSKLPQKASCLYTSAF